MAGGKDNEKELYFLVEGIKYHDVVETLSLSKSNQGLKCLSIHAEAHPIGREISINNKILLLFKYRGLMYAMDSHCPHMGGPLHLGDIEELGETKVPCLVCPWHHWKFEIRTGDVRWPMKENVKVAAYPVKVMEDGSMFVGFERISEDYFNCVDNF